MDLLKVFDSFSSNIDKLLSINPSAVFVFGNLNVWYRSRSIEQYCVIISFLFLYRCDEFGQLNSDCVILYVFSCKGKSIWNKRCWTPIVAAFQIYVWSLSELLHEEQRRLLLNCSGFFINNLDHVHNRAGRFY